MIKIIACILALSHATQSNAMKKITMLDGTSLRQQLSGRTGLERYAMNASFIQKLARETLTGIELAKIVEATVEDTIKQYGYTSSLEYKHESSALLSQLLINHPELFKELVTREDEHTTLIKFGKPDNEEDDEDDRPSSYNSGRIGAFYVMQSKRFPK